MHNARHADKNTCPLVVSGDAAHTADLKDLLLLVEDLRLLEHGGAVGEAIEGLGDLLLLVEGLGLLEEGGAVRQALEGLGDLLPRVEGLGLLEHGGAVRQAIEGLGDLLLLGFLEYEKQGASARVVLPREGTLAVRADHDFL